MYSEVFKIKDDATIKVEDTIVFHHTDGTVEKVEEPDPKKMENYECERFVEKLGYAWAEWKSLCTLYSEGNGACWRRIACKLAEKDPNSSEAKLERRAKGSQEYTNYLKGWRTAEKLEKDYYSLYNKWQNHFKTKLRLMEIFSKHGKAY